MWRPVVMVLAGLAGYGILVLLAWLEHEADAGTARQDERERGRQPTDGGAGRPARRMPGTPPSGRHAAGRRLG
jgi:hypothetical protein